jgi:Domain of unknown function (DUF397)
VSSHSDNGTCVEVASAADAVLVRNSNHPQAGAVAFTRAEFAAWVKGCKAGEFDNLA